MTEINSSITYFSTAQHFIDARIRVKIQIFDKQINIFSFVLVVVFCCVWQNYNIFVNERKNERCISFCEC